MRVALFFLGLCAAAQETTVIRNATVHPVSSPPFVGNVVVQGGKIVAAGANVMIPGGAKVIEATGKHVIPGIIDCHTHIALDSINEGTVSVSSIVSVGDMVNPEDPSIYRALAGGVTTANALHGSANAIGGQNVVIKMRWGKSAEDLVMQEAPKSIKFALGENPKRQGQGGQSPLGGSLPPRYPGTRMGVEDVIRQAFVEAREYQAAWKRHQANPSGLAPRRDLRLEPLVEVLEGKRLVHAHCYRADEILMLLRLADEFGFKIATLQHVLEGYKVAKEIQQHGAGASTFSDWWSYKMEAWDAIPYNAAILHKKGVLVSLNSDDASGAEIMRRLNTEAAKAVKYGGVSPEEALAMITLNPARQMGIDKYVGSIEAGKQADLVIYDKDPLSIYARVERVFIDGVEYFNREADLAGRAEKEARKKGLIEKERARQKQNAPRPNTTDRRPS